VASSKDLDLLLARLRADFADQNGEAWVGLRAAILGQDGPASAEWDLVFDTVEGLDSSGLDLADWVNFCGDMSVDIGPASDVLGSSNVEWLEFHWEWDVLEGHILNWGLNSDIDVLLGSWVKEEIDLDLVLWVVDFNHGLLRVPVVVGLDSSEDLVGDVLENGRNILVVNFNFVVHQVAGFKEWRVDSNRRAEVFVLASFFILIHGIFGVFLEHASLFLGSFTLNLDGYVVAAGFSRSAPSDFQVANQFLSGKFTESEWGVRVEDLTLNTDLEWLRVNFGDSRSLQDGLKFAISESFSALQLGFQVGFQFFVGSLGGKFSLDDRFPWSGGFVASPVALESFLIFGRGVKVEFVEVGSEGFREGREDFAGKLENDLLWNLRGWGGLDGDLVGSRKWAEWCARNVVDGGVVPLSVQLHSETKNFLAQFLNFADEGEVLSEVVLSGPFFTMDGLFLWFFPGCKVFGPDSGEGDWSAFKSEPVDRLLWWLPSDLDRWLFTSEIDFDFSTDWSVDFSNSQDLQTRVDNWRPDLNAGYNGGDKAWVEFIEFNLD